MSEVSVHSYIRYHGTEFCPIFVRGTIWNVISIRSNAFLYKWTNNNASCVLVNHCGYWFIWKRELVLIEIMYQIGSPPNENGAEFFFMMVQLTCICRARSVLGVRMRTLGLFVGTSKRNWSCCNLSTIGVRYARVLPLPVSAAMSTFFPSCMCGIACTCERKEWFLVIRVTGSGKWWCRSNKMFRYNSRDVTELS